ncbi:hypothetical protein P154DRAFT_569073 [Amniculicola lignicola CBS 123094]|uniref:Uncharacterized protein n=1 Tax=Amniculicola lignicola CBS 123094 TaxID=1392246 RepID=A0A6A5WZP6_9PLEO|nr:hypothetical protein P154DRAFT_569073 [Amniculicola lignicola CBS 123094]
MSHRHHDPTKQRELFADWQRLRPSIPPGQYGQPLSEEADNDRFLTWLTEPPGPTGRNQAHMMLAHNRANSENTRISPLNRPPISQPPLPATPMRPVMQLQTPSLCPHYLHPACPQDLPYCPGCRVKYLLKEVQRATDQWRARGGPGPNPNGVTPFYVRMRSRWIKAKCQLVQYIGQLEEWAEMEKDWEKEHQEVWEKVEDDDKEFVKSATEALYKARRECPLLECEESDFAPRGRDEGEGEKKEKKKVTWDEGIPECEQRQRLGFLRGHQLYEPGRWAAESGQSWLNTSFLTETSFGDPEHDKMLDKVWGEEPVGPGEGDTSEDIGEVTKVMGELDTKDEPDGE